MGKEWCAASYWRRVRSKAGGAARDVAPVKGTTSTEDVVPPNQYRDSWLPSIRTRSPGRRSPGVGTSNARVEPSLTCTSTR